ncbi:hypothetical protein SB772_40160, partial [Paraburkholderia sp. SIMBA_030]
RVQGQQQKLPLTPAQRKMEKGMMYGDGGQGQEIQPPANGGTPGAGPLGGGNGGQQNGLGSMLSSTKTPMAVASILPDPDYLIQKGEVIDCIA